MINQYIETFSNLKYSITMVEIKEALESSIDKECELSKSKLIKNLTPLAESEDANKITSEIINRTSLFEDSAIL